MRERGKLVPKEIIGARIIGFGAAPIEGDIEGGRLILDYIPAEADVPKRLVLGFNELGMWIEYLGERRDI
jgi:hypothetical protein